MSPGRAGDDVATPVGLRSVAPRSTPATAAAASPADESLRDLPDRALLAAYWASGSQAAFTVLVERYQPLVVGTCYRVLADRGLAQDAAQAVFLALAQKADQLLDAEPGRSLGGWLYAAAVAAARGQRRAAARRSHYEQAAAGDRPRDDGGQEQRRRDAGLLVEELLGRLNQPQREALVLRFLLGCTEAEAAAQLGLPIRTLHNRVARGLERLRAAARGRGPGQVSDPALLLPALLVEVGHLPHGLAPAAQLARAALGRTASRCWRVRPRRSTTQGPAAAVGVTAGVIGVIVAVLATTSTRLKTPPPSPPPPVTVSAPITASSGPGAPPTPRLGMQRAIPTTSPRTGLAIRASNLVWSCGWDRHLQGLDPATRQVRTDLVLSCGLRGLTLSPDGAEIALAGADHQVHLVTLATDAMRLLPAFSDDVTAVAYAPDGRSLAAVGRDGHGAVWDLPSGQRRLDLPTSPDHWWGVAWSPDSRQVLAVGDDPTALATPLDGSAPIAFVSPHGVLRAVAVAPDGATVATGGDGGVCLWDRSGRLLAALPGLHGLVQAVAFSADSHWLAAGTIQGGLALWSVADRHLIEPGPSQTDAINDLHFSPDGTSLVTAGDRPMRWWSLAIPPADAHPVPSATPGAPALPQVPF